MDRLTVELSALAFQAVVLQEDEPLVTNQDPPEMDLSPGAELSVRTDRVSIEYRRWLKELVGAVADGSDAVHRVVTAERTLGDVPSPG